MWDEIRTQAKQDLKSSQTLFDSYDYGNSAYLLQQGVEKYVKSFILRYNLFVKEPHKFQHLPIIKMWEIIIQELESRYKHFKKDVKEFAKQLIVLLKHMLEFFIKIRDREHKDFRWKQSIWKYSMSLPLNKSETDLMKNLKNDLEDELVPMISDAYDIFSKAKDRLLSVMSANTQQKRMLETLLEKVMSTTIEFEMSRKKPTTDINKIVEQMPEWFEQLEKLIKEILVLTDKKERILDSYFMRVLLLGWLFSTHEEMILTFPHEEIGRYPNMITDSRKIYEKNSTNLQKFINRITEKCEKIDCMLNL
ncbi:MAG: HEPN domain-containing protein [Nitrosarchaeum sp.]|nr:HEPN domain-containing protein [Nitrosarchaeum sp.]